ncbi:MAG: hypothetical protein R3B72_08075 [Polyangiaceae bacterium]
MTTRFFLLAAAVLAAASCDALVGGQCADGYAPEDGHCVPTDVATGAGGSDEPGGAGGEGASDGGGGATSEGGGGTTSVGGAGGSGGCGPGLTDCDGACVDTDSSIFHCGMCHQYCITESCVNGTCEGDTVGHATVVGMSYESWNVPMRRLLGNAVFMHPNAHVRIVDFRAYALGSASKNVDSLLAIEAGFRNRTYELDSADDAIELGQLLETSSYDVLLIHDQVLAPSGYGVSFAQDVALPIQAFSAEGGMVVVLATSTEMAPLLTETSLLQVGGFVDMTDNVATLAPTDALAIGVPSPFASKPHTVGIGVAEAASPTMSFVFADAGDPSSPVVVHKVIIASP